MADNTHSKPITDPMLKPGNLAREGMELGFRAVLILSVSYACLGMLIAEIAGVGIGFNLFLFILLSPIICLTICILGLVPAMLYAVVTGWILGRLAKLLNQRISRFAFVALCLGVCILIATASYAIIGSQMDFSLQDSRSSIEGISFGIYTTYPFWLGIPSVIYILAGGWAGWKLYDKTAILKTPPAA